MTEIAYTTVQAVAEILQGRMQPEMRASGNYDFFDLCDEVRNAFAGILWKVYMTNMGQDGERTALEASLAGAGYPATPDTKSVELVDAMIVDLPRDAGLYDVVAEDKNHNFIISLVKTNPALAHAPKNKMLQVPRYYRQGRTIYFPDGLPDCTAFVYVTWYGLNCGTDELIPRDYADAVRDKVWNALYPSKQITADITENKNPNQ